MLGLFSNKPAHPLADVRELKRVLADIASGEPLVAVENADVWLESIVAEEGFKLPQRLELILALEDAATTQARRLARDYPALVGAKRAQEARQWQVADDFWQHLAAAYGDCITRLAQGDKDRDAMRARLALLYCRTIMALAARLKWKQFRYVPVAPEFWTTVGAAYLAAVDAKVAQTPLQAHAGSAQRTVEQEYLKVLVFHATSMDKLQPLEIELAEHLIDHFTPSFALIREVKPENVYWVDAAKPLPPTRLAKSPELTPTLRFFNGTRAMAAVAEVLEEIRRRDRISPGINLGAQYAVGVVVPVLEHLARCWSPKPPMRSNVRHRTSSSMLVVNGLATLHRRLSGRGIESDGVESWVVDDVSLGGLGAQVPISARDWIRIGALVGLQPEGGDNWLLGVVRRYVRTEAHKGAVGIETLSKTPRAVTADAGGLATEALLLDIPDVGGDVRMALPANTFEENVALVFTLDDKTARLHPREAIARDIDFVIANFFVQSFS